MGNNENIVHHQLQKSKIAEMNSCVTKLTNFVRSTGNPYCIDISDDTKLKNFVTQIYAEDNVVASRIN